MRNDFNKSPEELESYEGRRATANVDEGNFAVEVRVRKARVIFGRLEFQVEPIFGTGKAWINESRIELGKE